MSCSMTVAAVRERRKTVTRRHVNTWTTLKPGDRLTLIEKGMGLPKGASQVVLAEVEIVAVDVRPLFPITFAEVVREGLATEDDLLEGMTPEQFCQFWMEGHGYGRHRLHWQFEAELTPCRRIEWRYLDSGASTSDPEARP